MKTKEISIYEQQASDFLEKTGTEFEAKFLYHGPYFEDDDKEFRNVYEIILKRNKKVHTFKFGDSIVKSNKYMLPGKFTRNYANKTASYDNRWIKNPDYKSTVSAYDVLAILTKCDPGTFEDFCADYGYDTDSKKAEKTYFSIQEEWQKVYSLFHDVLDELAEIQ